MAGLLRFLFYFLLIYFVVRFIRQHVLPFFRNVAEINQRQKSRETFRANAGLRKSRPGREDGEYVDFTEIQED